jgi:hypothetical protein
MPDEQTHRHRDLPIVVKLDERPGHHTYGVVDEGAFVPIAQHVSGLVEGMKQRWSELGGVTAESDERSSVGNLEDRVAELERQVLELSAKPEPKPTTRRASR